MTATSSSNRTRFTCHNLKHTSAPQKRRARGKQTRTWRSVSRAAAALLHNILRHSASCPIHVHGGVHNTSCLLGALLQMGHDQGVGGEDGLCESCLRIRRQRNAHKDRSHVHMVRVRLPKCVLFVAHIHLVLPCTRVLVALKETATSRLGIASRLRRSSANIAVRTGHHTKECVHALISRDTHHPRYLPSHASKLALVEPRSDSQRVVFAATFGLPQPRLPTANGQAFLAMEPPADVLLKHHSRTGQDATEAQLRSLQQVNMRVRESCPAIIH